MCCWNCVGVVFFGCWLFWDCSVFCLGMILWFDVWCFVWFFYLFIVWWVVFGFFFFIVCILFCAVVCSMWSCMLSCCCWWGIWWLCCWWHCCDWGCLIRSWFGYLLALVGLGSRCDCVLGLEWFVCCISWGILFGFCDSFCVLVGCELWAFLVVAVSRSCVLYWMLVLGRMVLCGWLFLWWMSRCVCLVLLLGIFCS